MSLIFSPFGSRYVWLKSSAETAMAGYNFAELRMMVVDPNLQVRHLITGVLQAFGCSWIRKARSAEEALEFLKHYPADIMISEWDLEPTTGQELLTHIRTAPDSPNKYLPVVILTGNTNTADVIAARDAGMTEFIAKPFTAEALMRRLIEIIDRPRDFVESEKFAGPDRRRRRSNYQGDERRGDNREGDASKRRAEG